MSPRPEILLTKSFFKHVPPLADPRLEARAKRPRTSICSWSPHVRGATCRIYTCSAPMGLETRRKRPQKPENQVCYWLQLCIILNQQHSYPKSFKKLSGPEPAEVQGLKNHSTNTANNNRRRYLRLGCVGMCSLRLGCVGFSGVFRAALLPGRWLAWGFLCMMRW